MSEQISDINRAIGTVNRFVSNGHWLHIQIYFNPLRDWLGMTQLSRECYASGAAKAIEEHGKTERLGFYGPYPGHPNYMVYISEDSKQQK